MNDIFYSLQAGHEQNSERNIHINSEKRENLNINRNNSDKLQYPFKIKDYIYNNKDFKDIINTSNSRSIKHSNSGNSIFSTSQNSQPKNSLFERSKKLIMKKTAFNQKFNGSQNEKNKNLIDKNNLISNISSSSPKMKPSQSCFINDIKL